LVQALASSTPSIIISTSNVKVEATEKLDFLTQASFDPSSDNLAFSADSEIDFILILDSNDNIEFQLPVDSNMVQINKNLFGKGNYKLGFRLKGQEQVHITKVTIK